MEQTWCTLGKRLTLMVSTGMILASAEGLTRRSFAVLFSPIFMIL